MRPMSWRPSPVFMVLAAAAVLFGTGCHRPGADLSQLTVAHQVTPEPVKVGPVSVTITLTDSSSRPVTGARMTIEADMSHAGMSPVFAAAPETQPGHYRSQLSLGMAGDWVMLVHGALPGGEKLERQFDVPGVQSP